MHRVARLAKTLAKVGGGTLSIDLAIDLLLNETVEQAREVTRATGAAIALFRDGEMICRATSGNAPELGTPVDTASGLSGACLKTGTIQECCDTEADARVDRNACRQLNVRSMVLVPILEDGTTSGILEVFSSLPNNFGRVDVETLQELAKKAVRARMAAGPDVSAARTPSDPEAPQAQYSPAQPQMSAQASPKDFSDPATSAIAKNEVLSSALVVLIIAAAILLGVVVGVRQMAKRSERAQAAVSPKSASVGRSVASPVNPAPEPAVQPAAPAHRGPEPPVGGLVVTQNGKVIYRDSPDNKDTIKKSAQPLTPLLHRVEPQYPEAAKLQHIQGAVVLEAEVLGDGTVGKVAVLRGEPLLAEAATQAVKQWKYQPYFVDGRPAQRQERITVRFSLPSS